LATLAQEVQITIFALSTARKKYKDASNSIYFSSGFFTQAIFLYEIINIGLMGTLKL
jgi:hypothetical protein